MLMTEFGWTMANPPDTRINRSAIPHVSLRVPNMHVRYVRTEELLAAATLFDHLDQTRLQLLNGRNVVREDTHLSGLGGNVDLDDILGLVDGLLR